MTFGEKGVRSIFRLIQNFLKKVILGPDPFFIGVYNPFSLLNAFFKRDFGSYWFESGIPDFLIKKLKDSKIPLYKLTDGVTATEAVLKDYRVDDPDPIPLFYQSGYLTTSGYDPEFRIYTLCLPNEEVKYGFLNSLQRYNE